MPLTILTDAEVRSLLHSLTREDILDLQQSLADALHYYSTATDENSCCSSYQPQRTSVKRKDGTTTLFMPASGSTGFGVKIVTLTTPDEPKRTEERGSVSSTSDSVRTSSTRSSEATDTEVPPPSIASTSSTTPRGSLTLLEPNGTPRAMMNAEELTAFRTALCSTMLFKRRHSVHDLLVFGAGKQAYWHIRIALLLRGAEIHHVNVINRSFQRAQEMIQSLVMPQPSSIPGVNTHELVHNAKFSVTTPAHTEYGRYLKQHVRQADAIFATTPSLEPLFPASYLTSTEGRRKGRYIAAIGSYKPHMVEIHPDILKQAVAPHTGHHFHKHAQQGGAVIVDSVSACLQEAGEVIQAGLRPDEVVELGELVMLRREAESEAAKKKAARDLAHATGKLSMSEHTDSGVELSKKANDGGLRAWLEKGNVIFKCVGLGLMDVAVGGELVRIAEQRKVGTTINDF